MTDEEKENSGLGREIMFEWLYSPFAKEHSHAEKRRSAEEDAKDTAKRVALVMAANSAAPFPYPPKKIRSLIRRRRKDIENYSINLYSIDLFGYSHQTEWKPDVDRLAIVKSMVAETYHKEAFRMVGESDRLEKLSRRRNLAQFFIDIPKYVFVGIIIICVLLAFGIIGDVISYLYRAPTVVAIERILKGLYVWLFTEAGFITACAIIVAGVAFMKIRKILLRIVGKAETQ